MRALLGIVLGAALALPAPSFAAATVRGRPAVVPRGTSLPLLPAVPAAGAAPALTAPRSLGAPALAAPALPAPALHASDLARAKSEESSPAAPEALAVAAPQAAAPEAVSPAAALEAMGREAAESGGEPTAQLGARFDGRVSGILLHPTSLPGPYGVGDIGPEARRFVDFLQKAGQKRWQVLPLTPTDAGAGHSPYSSPSAFARNPLLISPEQLALDGWLAPEDLAGSPASEGPADFAAAEDYKARLFDAVWRRYQAAPRLQAERAAFERDNGYWLEDYALFVAIKQDQDGKPWSQWPEPLKAREPQALAAFRAAHSDAVERAKLLQFVFARQWGSLRSYAAERGVRLVGDLPIYIAHDSADVWAHRELFALDETGAMKAVSGVPPDMFSADGQLWGTPVYDWDASRASGHAWWLERLRRTFDLVDTVRVDHFRGLVQYWRVPAGAKTAKAEEGAYWADGAGDAFFAAVASAFPGALIAEDLGVITDDVVAVMKEHGFPGMRVLQFAFGDPDISSNPHLPDNHQEEGVAYTGTHDNDTTRGWLEKASARERGNLDAYLRGKGVTPARSLAALAWQVLELALRSVSRLVILPLQDALGLGSEARMNMPGTAAGNWGWRLKSVPGEAEAHRLRELTASAGR